MTKKGNKGKGKGGKPNTKKTKGIKGSGDYDLNGDMAYDDAIEDIDKRLNRLEKIKPSANGASTLVGQGAGILGRLAGGFLGGPAGSALGEQAATGLARFLGHGDYNIVTNSLIGKPPRDEGMPKFDKDGQRGTRICEREYIGDIYSGGTLVSGSTTFDLRSFPLNPGMSITFPWLSTIAQGYESYKPNGIIFEFKSTASSFNGTSSLGGLAMATDYDATDPNFINKTQMEAADYSDSCAADKSMMHGIECDAKERGDNVLYVRSGTIPSNDNLRFYDLGTFQIATQGMATAGANLGELWVSYDFTFYKKNLTNGFLGYNVIYNVLTNTVAETQANPLGTPRIYGNAGCTIGSSNVLKFDPLIASGVFLIEYYAEATGFAGGIGFTAPVNCEDLPATVFTPNYSINQVISAVVGKQWQRQFVRITGRNATLTLTLAGAVTAGTKAELLVLQMNGNPNILANA
jgi:hypothetical protein